MSSSQNKMAAGALLRSRRDEVSSRIREGRASDVRGLTRALSAGQDARQLKYWLTALGVSKQELLEAIDKVGNAAAGFILTTILGIVGAFVATYLGQALGWYRPGEGAGLIGAVVGAIIVLLVYGMIAGRRRVV
jgi:uncharacterized membrane protein YeaQ/YmgE (transglycosylase-associated protein family)